SITLLFKLCYLRRRIWSNCRPYCFSVVAARLCRRVAFAPLSSAVASCCKGKRRGGGRGRRRVKGEAFAASAVFELEDSRQCCYLCCCLC
ncbi:hypothetical protein HN51_063395, partial [Arachis hypogaea]